MLTIDSRKTTFLKLENGKLRATSFLYFGKGTSDLVQFEVVQVLAETTPLLFSYGQPFEELYVYREGDRWVAKLVATVDHE